MHILRIIPNYKAKQLLLSYYFKGIDENHFKQIANDFSLKQIDNIVRPQAMARIRWHKESGHKVVVVSASMECWLKAWCEKNNLELIGTKLKFHENVFTGQLATNNWYGQEKVNRIRNSYDLDDFSYIYAYGDSEGDREMLAIANENYFKVFWY